MPSSSDLQSFCPSLGESKCQTQTDDRAVIVAKYTKLGQSRVKDTSLKLPKSFTQHAPLLYDISNDHTVTSGLNSNSRSSRELPGHNDSIDDAAKASRIFSVHTDEVPDTAKTKSESSNDLCGRSTLGDASSATEEKIGKKSTCRPKKVECTTQRKIGKGKVRKAHVQSNVSISASRQFERRPSGIRTPCKSPEPPPEFDFGGTHSLGLEKAVARKRDWTPVKDHEISAALNSRAKSLSHTSISQLDEVQNVVSHSIFKTLTTSFTFESAKQPLSSSKDLPPDSKKKSKRRKLELSDPEALQKEHLLSVGSKNSSVPKKKPLTITEKATRPFAFPKPGDHTESPNLLSYFPASQADQSTSLGQSHKRKPKAKKKEPPKQPLSTLLSPEKALGSLEDQDLCFGTSSQLVREDSPTVVRDLQLATKNSETEVPDCDSGILRDVLQKPSRLYQARSALWSASSRDLQGCLLSEVVDLTTSLTTPIGFRSTNSLMHSISPTKERVTTDTYSSCGDTGDSGLTKHQPQVVSEKSLDLSQETPCTPASLEKLTPDFAQMPLYELQKRLANYGFKPTKSRKRMISILERCRASTQNRSQSGTGTGSVIECNEDVCRPTSQPKQRQRPQGKKVTKTIVPGGGNATLSPTLAHQVPNLLSSAESASLPPPSSQMSSNCFEDTIVSCEINANDHVTCPLDNSHSSISTRPSADDIVANNRGNQEPDAAKEQEFLFSKITEAISSCTPTTDPQNPSWYEKILLYDPIVIEDLTIWLNTAGFKAVGVDDEVWPTLVRDWCESKSICCLWKQNLNKGGTRARY